MGGSAIAQHDMEVTQIRLICVLVIASSLLARLTSGWPLVAWRAALRRIRGRL
jgi:hypothetical protein